MVTLFKTVSHFLKLHLETAGFDKYAIKLKKYSDTCLEKLQDAISEKEEESKKQSKEESKEESRKAPAV